MGVLHPRPNILLFAKRACDFNVTTDNTLVKQFACATFAIQQVRVCNASISLTTAVGGIYTAATKGGIAVVANTQGYSALTGATLGMTAVVSPAGLDELTADALYLNLTTAQGAAAIADVFVFGWPLT